MKKHSPTVEMALKMVSLKRTPSEQREAFEKLDREDVAKGSRVYFAAANGVVKIGRTIDLYGRLATLRTVQPDLELLLSLPGGRRLEAELQGRFGRYAIGKEWFELSDEIRAFIARGGSE